VTSRTAALALTVLGAGVLFFMASEQAATALGLVCALIAVAAIWLASGRVRAVLAGFAALGWLGALVLGVGSGVAVAGSLLGLAGSVIALWRGGSWPGFSARYARQADVAEDEAVTPRQLWESLDRGLDPTRGKDATPDDDGSG
jgi:hypothetical protein